MKRKYGRKRVKSPSENKNSLSLSLKASMTFLSLGEQKLPLPLGIYSWLNTVRVRVLCCVFIRLPMLGTYVQLSFYVILLPKFS